MFARDCEREDLRHVPEQAGGADEEDQGGAERRSEQLHGAGGERNGDEGNFELHRGGEEGRAVDDRRRARGGGRLRCGADDYR